MVPLDRKGVTEPKGWERRVKRRLADHDELKKKARAFERLKLSGKKRQDGFVAYAGHVFKLKKGSTKPEFPAVWRCKELKGSLRKMTKGKCAYCQGDVDATSHAAVEHFKPKSLFPTLAYEVGNYLYSCPLCNEAKSDNWPASGEYVRPDNGDPRGRFRFKKSGWMKVIRGDGDALATVRDFGLNRAGLRVSRENAIRRELKKLKSILKLLMSSAVPDSMRLTTLRPFLVPMLGRYSEAINQNVRRAVRKAFPTLTFP